jgi:RimJ/RimL family protein N-acetyltransferase
VATPPVSAPALSTERLVLRTWRPSDHAPFAALNADPEVMEHFPAALTRDESDALIARIEAGFAQHPFGLWATEVVETGEFIGFVGLAVPNFDAPFMPTVEVGWRLARGAWGHGYASEAAREALRYAFDDVGLDEVVSFTSVSNLRSQRVMQRIGLHHDQDFDHPRIPEGHRLHRHVLYRITRDEWKQQAARPA